MTIKKLGTHDRKRIFPGIKGRRPDRKNARRATAEASREIRAALSPAEQMTRLDRVLGKNVGAKRERARLAKMIGRAA